ncbi:hypothetical protein GOB94_04425 [Granulicella sp. 5B5]|uniref:hypothetical protein n=1 Tax=Granulicella sp. 5B5 TaxID=1617967 RepID=UPI0015F397AB|nr:hypothetical protein [Granulicella sp. 5B5]QMV18018.1 hypothetical protein GOB94_04425 [Granulicella sp. 5B5]
MSTLTLVHVAISLVGIAAGLVVVYGFLTGMRLKGWNWLFLVMTILTSVTGFFFPIHKVTPGIVLGVISLIVLGLALLALKNGWTKTYIITCSIAEFLNVLVLIVQLFMKIPALHALAPTGNEPITAVCKLVALVLFAVLAWLAIRKKAFVLV